MVTKVRVKELQLEYQARVDRPDEIRRPYAGKSEVMGAEEAQELAA